MSEEKTTKPQHPATMQVLRPPNQPSFYINGMRLAMSFADIRMYLLDINPALSESAPLDRGGPPQQASGQVAIELGCLICTPEFAKVFAHSLNAAIDTYESQFGKIREKPTEAPPPESK